MCLEVSIGASSLTFVGSLQHCQDTCFTPNATPRSSASALAAVASLNALLLPPTSSRCSDIAAQMFGAVGREEKKKITGVSNNINDGSVPFVSGSHGSCTRSHTCARAACDGGQPSLTPLVPLLFDKSKCLCSLEGLGSSRGETD